jgi:hypothetical protein
MDVRSRSEKHSKNIRLESQSINHYLFFLSLILCLSFYQAVMKNFLNGLCSLAGGVGIEDDTSEIIIFGCFIKYLLLVLK